MITLENEVRQLNQKVQGQQKEAFQLREEIRDIERRKEQEMKEQQQQLRDQLCSSQQQVSLSSSQQHISAEEAHVLCVRLSIM